MEEEVRAFVAERANALEVALESAHAEGLPVGAVPLEHFHARVVRSLVEQLASIDGAEDALKDLLASTWSKRTASILSDHAWSLACEQHPSWRPPTFDPQRAHSCFSTVFVRDAPSVERFIRANFGARGIDAESTASSAWSRVYDAYWSPAAVRPFGGRARIRTAVTTTARRLAVEELERRAPGTAGDEREGPDPGPVSLVYPAAEREELELELQRDFQDCLEQLPPRRRLVAHLLWQEDLTPTQIKTQLGLQLPGIANHKAKASIALADCMTGKGYENWENAKLRSSR